MLKRTFKYCATHKEDERYMQDMCSKGWAAIRFIEGFWTFESCRPNQYFYRVFYARNIKKSKLSYIIKQYKKDGIEFVFRYSFWILFRSHQPFDLYTKEEELSIYKKIYAPMPVGAIVSFLMFLFGLHLSYTFNFLFFIPTVCIGIYGSICTWLAFSYHKLIKEYEE